MKLTQYTFDARNRIEQKLPSLKCKGEDSQYSVSNKKLHYPINLLTSDEAIMAGYAAVYENDVIPASGKNYLLQNYGSNEAFLLANYAYAFIPWEPISPFSNDFIDNGGGLFGVAAVYNNDSAVDGFAGLRPVINIKANTLFKGTGTITDPYVIAN